MKRMLTSLLLLLALPLAAQEAAQPPTRFAFFTLGLLVEKSVKAKKIFGDLETLQKSLNDKLQAKAKEGQAIQQQLQSASLANEGREKLTKQLRDVEYDYKKLQEDSQAEFAKVQQRVLGEIYQVAGPIISDLAKEQKLQLVFSGESAQQAQLVQWADEKWIQDFTLEVAKRLDASNAVPTAKPPVVPTVKPPVAKPMVPPAVPPVVKKP